jgi:arsenate reductase-like glutaredoxin family protein
VQAYNGKNSDKEKQLANQRDTIKKVIDWLREEGLEPQEITHLRKDACYYGVVLISNEEEEEEKQRKEKKKNRDDRLFTFFFQLIGLIV